MEEKYERKENEMKEEIRKVKSFYHSELKIKDMILKRQLSYITVLTKELVVAKNIIKNPRAAKQFGKEMNFKNMDLYQYNDKNQL